MKKAVIFDRDGTLIIDKIYLNDPDQIEYLPDVFPALQKLRDAGFEFAIATNQSGIARGIVSLENLNEIHRRMKVKFAEHGIEFKGYYYAPYSVESNHPLRKPNAGMLELAAKENRFDLRQSWMIGDRLTDVEAGHRAGCKTILLEGLKEENKFSYAEPTFVARDLLSAADFIIKSSR
jgi:D-glycero-D-manno-heptose 1,7-bisphosphate phosphatase